MERRLTEWVLEEARAVGAAGSRGEKWEDQGLARAPSPGRAGLPVLILAAPLPPYLTFRPQRLGLSPPLPRL